MELSAVARPTRARRHDSIGRRMKVSVNTEANQQTSLTFYLYFLFTFNDSLQTPNPYHTIPYHHSSGHSHPRSILLLLSIPKKRQEKQKQKIKEKMASQALLTPSPLLKPLVTLAGWTFVMELWMYATRIPAISNYKLSTDPAKISEELQTKIPIHIRQVADKYAINVPSSPLFLNFYLHDIYIKNILNLTKLIVFFFSDIYFISYNHLHEQPTVFYAVTLALAILGDNHPYTLQAAWTYVGLRIVHSVFQSLVNKVMVSNTF